MRKELPVFFKRKEECCGCTACYAICPVSAITMVEDKEGFEYPHVDETKCVRCHICLTMCPMKIDIQKKTENENKPALSISINNC